MLLRTDSRELTEWYIFGTLEPFGPQAANLNAGLVASIVANVNRGKDSKVYEPSDFALGEFEKEEQSVEEMAELLRQIAEASKKNKVIKKSKKEK